MFEPVDGADASLRGAVVGMGADGAGGLWAVVGGAWVLHVDRAGTSQGWKPEMPDGAAGIRDLAVGPAGEVYVLLDGNGVRSSVYSWDADDGIAKVFGTAVTSTLAEFPASPDGSDAQVAQLGEIVDLTVLGDGTVVFAETVSPDGAGLTAPVLVRAVGSDGHVTTLAGRPWAGSAKPTADDIDEAALPEEGADPREIDLIGSIALVAEGDRVLVRTFRAVFGIGSNVELIMGSVDGAAELPQVESSGPFSEFTNATDARFVAMLDPYGFAVNSDGSLLVGSSGSTRGQENEDFRWTFSGSDAAHSVADARDDTLVEHGATLLVTPSGQVTTADMASYDAVWLDEETIAVSMFSGGESIIVTVPVPAGDLPD